MKGPPVNHDDGILGYKAIFIPIIFDIQVILTEFIYRSPSEDFLEFNPAEITGTDLDDCTDIRKIGFVVVVWWTIASNDPI